MPNIAFTTLIVVLLAFPGYIVRSSYFSDKFSKRLLPKSWTDDIVKAVLYSLPLHLAAIVIFELLQHRGIIQHTLHFEIAFRLLAGEFGKAAPEYSPSQIVEKLYSNRGYLLIYYFGVVGGAYTFGHGMRMIVWKYEWDVKWPAVFGYRNDWLYALMGRGKLFVPHESKWGRLMGRAGKGSVRHEETVVILDALTDQETEVPGKAQLYSGIVAGFTTDESGALREIVLTKTKRGKFAVRETDPVSKFLGKFVKVGESDYTFSLETIPGRDFILKYSVVRNLNLTYLPVNALASGAQ